MGDVADGELGATSRIAVNIRASLRIAAAAIALVAVPLGSDAVSAANRTTSQAASPTAAGAASCKVAPRSLGALIELTETSGGLVQSAALGTPIAPQVPPSGGVPADRDVTAAAEELVAEQVACTNAGDLPRAASLWSDDYVRRLLGGLSIEVLTELSTPTPLPEVDQAVLKSVQDVRVLDDGRMSAVVTTTDATSLVVFVESDGRYLIDDSIVLSPRGTPAP